MPKRAAAEITGVKMASETTPRKKKTMVAKNGASRDDAQEYATYTAQQKAAINEFVGITQADKSSAGKVLKQHNWNVSLAVNGFYNNPSNTANNPLRSNLNQIFDSYREDSKSEPNDIGIQGTGDLLTKLGIDVEDVGALVFSEIVASPSLGRITRDGFVDGWSAVNIDTLPKMRNLVLQRRGVLSTDKDIFKQVYNHAFVLPLQPGSKTLALDTAVAFWGILFGANGMPWQTANTPWTSWWFEYLEGGRTKAVNKDLWRQVLTFALETIKDDTLGFWNEESSWPSVVDDFVEWVKKEKRPSATDAMEVE